ncbi:imelysin family protein [Geofilum sp. OHC36d9]|uniref:imelysin family protein n=1 Tax=Geofilum sp. OHC36d9 TaxID=3458413 RepID=UPI00403381CD
MKKLNLLFYFFIVGAVMLGFSSCDDDDDGITDEGLDVDKTEVISRCVNNVIVSTYKNLADESVILYDACFTLKSSLTQDNIDAACAAWIAARKYWEQSEAFLYGAASDYNIDPHIDSWPLDKSQLDLALNNETLISNMDEEGCNFDGFSTLGYGLLGFHAVEYMLFRDGAPRDVDGGTDSDGNTYEALSQTELIYCAAVAEDLRNQCIRLEASWAGIDNIGPVKQTILTDAELEPSMDYGEAMETAGESGNVLYKTQIAAYVQILQGAADISDEVGNTKITDPVSSGDVLDVESWYSWNSIDDFANNMRSVQYVYLGNTSSTAVDASVSAYVKSLDETLDNAIQTAIATAIIEIESMPAPFRNYLTESASSSAKAACNAVMDKLEEAITLIQE